MEKLDKVIAGLEQCHRDIKYRDCDRCGYAGAGSECERCLMEDALECLGRLREENRDLRKDIEVLTEELTAAREKLSWLEPMRTPNDWGEYPPEFPREGM